MAKFIADAILDAALDELATGTILTVCTQQPTTRTEAVTTYKLADVVIDGSDFTKGNGDVSGRKVTISAQNDIDIDDSGTATHIAICDSSNVLLVTTCTSQVLTSGGTVSTPAFAYEIQDAS